MTLKIFVSAILIPFAGCSQKWVVIADPVVNESLKIEYREAFGNSDYAIGSCIVYNLSDDAILIKFTSTGSVNKIVLPGQDMPISKCYEIRDLEEKRNIYMVVTFEKTGETFYKNHQAEAAIRYSEGVQKYGNR